MPAPSFVNPSELELARLPAKVTFWPLVSIWIGPVLPAMRLA